MTAVFNGNLLLINSLLKASTYTVDSIVYIYPIVYSLLKAYTSYSSQFIVYIYTIVYSLLKALTCYSTVYSVYIHHSAVYSELVLLTQPPPAPGAAAPGRARPAPQPLAPSGPP